MTLLDALERLGRRFVVTPVAAVAVALGLLILSLGLAVHNEDMTRTGKIEQARVQARILAGSVAAPLAFDDDTATRDYVAALRVNPEIEAAGAYRLDGTLAAGFETAHGLLPERSSPRAPAAAGNHIAIAIPVMQGKSRLGSVYLRVQTETVGRRAIRYLGIGIVLVMASLLVAVLGASYANVTAINRQLEDEIESRRRAEEALRQSQKMEAMGQLTGGVAHDFNNLLTPIIGGLDMLQRRKLGGDREQRIIDGALQSAERAKTLVQRLLAFARRQPLQARAVDVGLLISGLTDLLASTGGPQVGIDIDAPSSLPAAMADPHQLEMAILNLAVNARDAMPGGGTLTITVRSETIAAGQIANLAPGEYLRICVADTGAGMDAATLARAVEPFFSTKGIGKGTGLGLSMVHGLMAQLHGTMVIESAPGEGTAIHLYLPASDRPVDVEESEQASDAAHAGKGKVLLVDDEDIVRASTADMLVELGYEVVEARSAGEAVDLLDTSPAIRIVVTDHLMPGQTGADLARHVAERRPGLPVIIVSGYADSSGLPADLPRLTKPFRRAELADLLARVRPGAEA